MEKHIEIKAKIDNFDLVEKRVRELCTNKEYPKHITQEDTFFECTKGRLKLRRINEGKEGLLIAYHRFTIFFLCFFFFCFFFCFFLFFLFFFVDQFFSDWKRENKKGPKSNEWILSEVEDAEKTIQV